MNVEENEEVVKNVKNPEENISDKKDVVDADELKQIKYYIEHCQGREEWKEVIKIVRKNLIKYTENSNGSFLNLSMMDSKTIEDIKQFIKFCQDNEMHINTNEKKIEDEKIRLSTLVEETDSNVNESQRESTTTFTNQNSNTKT
jgi:predicted hydrocarbon binding protein